MNSFMSSSLSHTETIVCQRNFKPFSAHLDSFPQKPHELPYSRDSGSAFDEWWVETFEGASLYDLQGDNLSIQSRLGDRRQLC